MKNKIQLEQFVRQTVDVEVTLLPDGVSYWYLRKYCSPYNEQWIRVVHKNNRYKLTTFQLAYGEFKLRCNDLYYSNGGGFMNSKFNFVDKELAHINEGLSHVLFQGKGDHLTGCVEVKECTIDDFIQAINNGLQLDLID
jgi:hypothetical protein